jgi:Flp pilus assembly protein TadD
MRTVCSILVVLIVTTAASGASAQPTRGSAYDHFKAGMQALGTEQFSKAETEFRTAVGLDPLYDAAFYGLGQVYMATKRYPDAVKAYLDSREAFKAAVAAELAGALDTEKRLRDQIQALQDEVSRLERISVAQSPQVQNALTRNRDQIRQLQSRLNRSGAAGPPPIPAGLSFALGSAYYRVGDLASAEREYLEAIAVDAKFGEAHSNLAVIYMLTNRLDQADHEIALAEKAGFSVNPRLKEDLKNRRGR